MDVTASLFLADGRECKVITGIDDHSRFCVIATVVQRATARAVCLAFTAATAEYSIPGEVLSDNGKQFTGRFGKPRPAEVLFERICRENGITQRLTKPRSPTTTGKIERLHQTLQLELLNVHGPFASIEDAQAAVDAWRKDYNTRRPHQSLAMAYPAARFTPAADAIGLRVPAELTRQPPPSVPAPAPGPGDSAAPSAQDTGSGRQGQAVELGRLVPPSGNLWVARQQIWLGPAMTGRTVRLWAGLTQVHVLLDGHRIKTLGTRPLTTADSDGRPGGSIMLGSQAIWSMAHCTSRRMALPWNGPIKTPSLEVVNVAGDSAAGRDRIQSAPDLRRVHAQSAQQHRCRIWWLESEDLGQHLLARDIEPSTVGLRRVLKHFLGRGRHAEAIFFRDVSERRLLRHGAHRQRRSVGARPQAQSTQGFLIERLMGLASLLQGHAQHGFDRGILQQGEQDVIGASPAVTSAAGFLAGLQSDVPAVKHLWRCGFGDHDGSLLYLVCTDWRVMPRASPICCHDQPFSRADATWFASTLSARRCRANEARSPIAGSSDERFTLSSSMSMSVSLD